MMRKIIGTLCCLILACECFTISKVSTKTSSIPGSGMDKPAISLFGWKNGGTYSLTICQGERCCKTEELNTEDNNWELGQIDWFVGRQIGECNNFLINTESTSPVVLTLQHEGANAGMLDWVLLHSWHQSFGFYCSVETRLDYTSEHITQCELRQTEQWEEEQEFGCNGRPEFCHLRFDQFLFPGTHNSGTGESEGSYKCAYKNQDLDIIEQLEFGIRFFDIDVIYSEAFGCSGLETGHGSHPELGLYQCYGKMDSLLAEMRTWLDKHPSEVVVINFGNIEWAEETIPSLMETLMEQFSPEEGRVGLNKGFKETGTWPTMGEAVNTNKRVFIFLRDSVGAVTENELEIVREIKVKPGDDVISKNLTRFEASITTSYKARSVGSDCKYVLDTNSVACKSENQTETDFLKLSFFSKFGKGGVIGTECVHKMARKCNQWVKQAVNSCNYRNFKPNFVLVDYPNYQGQAEQSIVELCNSVNMERADMLLDKTAGDEIFEDDILKEKKLE